MTREGDVLAVLIVGMVLGALLLLLVGCTTPPPTTVCPPVTAIPALTQKQAAEELEILPWLYEPAGKVAAAITADNSQHSLSMVLHSLPAQDHDARLTGLPEIVSDWIHTRDQLRLCGGKP